MTPPAGNRIIPFPGPPSAALVLRVELLLQPRAVWRRLLLDGRATFWDLHVAIQAAFGWEDRHLHQFTVDDPDGGPPLQLGIPDNSGLPGACGVLAGWEHRLVPYLRRDAAAVLYVYDFAEERQHAVELEGTRGGIAPSTLPRCEEGEGWPPCEAAVGSRTQVAGRFVPEQVRFANPQQHWARKFGRD